ncbi:MAG: helix-turn-helix domain-containing protein, partial [Magnetospirillum sp.]|nr:helix-turn-helix domain-containing protein [Magnetospirillum sp.]
LYNCWPKATVNSNSRALLAVAHNLSRNFGLPGKLPMASSKAWRMLSTTTFEPELAQRLVDVGSFIADWQKTQRTFLILEFGEVELIEHLFEALQPSSHGDLLAAVMNFKVLSNRRMGLLRRIPNRLKRQVTPMLPDRKEEALVIMAHSKALLEKVADPSGFAPIVDTAGKMLEELEKMMKTVAAMGAPPQASPPGGGLQLGRMG